MGMTMEQMEALENELVALDYKAEAWTQEDLDRQAEIVKLLSEGNYWS